MKRAAACSAFVWLCLAGCQSTEISARADPVPAVEELRIGSASDSGPTQFNRITDVAVDRDGRIIVAQSEPVRVRVFDSTGAYVTAFASYGQGPGEFRMVNRVWPAGDSIVVIDWQSGGRGAVFDSAGNMLQAWVGTWPSGEKYVVAGRTPDGWLAYSSKPPSPPFTEGVAVRYSTRYVVLDERATAVRRDVRTTESVTRMFPGPRGGLDWPLFEPRHGSAMAPSGLYYKVPDPLQYSIEVRDNSDRLLRTISHSFVPRAIGEGDVDELLQMMERHYEQLPARPGWEGLETIQRLIRDRAAAQTVEQLSPIRQLLAGESGELWVERPDLTHSAARIEYEEMYTASARMPGLELLPTAWDRFDSSGNYRGTVLLPPGFTAYSVAGRRVYGVQKGADDVEFVVRMVAPESSEARNEN